MSGPSKSKAQLLNEIKILRRKVIMLRKIRTANEQKDPSIRHSVKYPSEHHPDPVLRISIDGILLYSNKASKLLLKRWDYKKDYPLSRDPLIHVRRAHRSGTLQHTEVHCGKRVFSLTFAPVSQFDFVDVYGLDTTELKKAEEELKREKAFIEKTLDAQVDTFFVFDPNTGKPFRWNKAFREISGYSDEEIASMKAPDDWYSDDDLKRAETVTQKIFRDERGTVEMSLITKDKRKIPTEYSASLIRDDAGNPVYFIAIGRDISERKNAEIVLKESEERFKGAFETAPIGMGLLSIGGQWLKVNASLCETIGYTEEELVTRTLRDIIHPDDLERDLASMRKIVSGEIKTYQREERYLHKRGQIVWIVMSISLIRDVNGRPVHFIVQINNITERRMAQEKLKEYSENLEQMVARRTKKLEEGSRKLAESQQALTYLLEDVNESREELKRANEALEKEISTRKTAEEEIKRYAIELESTNRELESFSYSVSHDLRAPLRSIDGFSQVILEDYSGCLDEQAMDHLRRVRKASQRMAALIDDLLKLSRVTRTEMKREDIDLTSMSRELLSEFKKSQPNRESVLIVQDGMTVKGDERLLRIMLQNLFDNAWKFTRKKKTVRIECGILKQKKNPTFFIRDNGTGFDMAYADKLFGPFQRLHSSSEFPGTGIGLATVQRIVHRHGGRIWGEAVPGKGATFYFTFH
jgi:PAS domain S-box-containing protein